MTEKTKTVYGFYFTAACLLASALVALRTASILREFEPTHGYFPHGASLFSVANLISAAAVVFFLTMTVSLGRKLDVKPAVPHLPTLFSSSFAAFMMLAFGVFHLLSLMKLLRDYQPKQLRVAVCLGIVVFFALVGAVAFVISAANGAEISAAKAVASCGIVLFCLFYTMYLYFESSLPLNADIKLLSQIALLSGAVFFLYETRISLGRPMWALRSATGMIAMVLSASVSLPNLIYYLLRRESVLGTPVHDFLLFSIFLYSLARLTSLTNRYGAPAGGFFGEALSATAELEDEPTSGPAAEQISFFADETGDPATTEGKATDDGSDIFRAPSSDDEDGER